MHHDLWVPPSLARMALRRQGTWPATIPRFQGAQIAKVQYDGGLTTHAYTFRRIVHGILDT
jgi:hypothetical protein